MSYTLSFQNHWEPEQLIRSGGEHDPLETELRTVSVDQYENAMSDRGRRVPRVYDFRLNGGCIMPALSSGLSTLTDETQLPSHFQETKERLWQLHKVTKYDGMQIIQMYPAEMQLKSVETYHHVIKPVAPVRPETFRQMLRCLPWEKMYSFEEVKRHKETKAKEKHN